MTVKYGYTPENCLLISEKAKNKKNGVYEFRGVAYRVKENKVTHIAYSGQILERYGNFNVEVGTYSGYIDDAKRLLRGIKYQS